MAQQTAVEWLVNELKSYTFHERIDMAEWKELKKLSRKAKQMEKEQLLDAYDNVFLDDNGNFLNGEQYYNETYGKE